MRVHSTVVLGALAALVATAAVADVDLTARRATRHDIMADRAGVSAVTTPAVRDRAAQAVVPTEALQPISELAFFETGDVFTVGGSMVAASTSFTADFKQVDVRPTRMVFQPMTAMDDLGQEFAGGLAEKTGRGNALVVHPLESTPR